MFSTRKVLPLGCWVSAIVLLCVLPPPRPMGAPRMHSCFTAFPTFSERAGRRGCTCFDRKTTHKSSSGSYEHCCYTCNITRLAAHVHKNNYHASPAPSLSQPAKLKNKIFFEPEKQFGTETVKKASPSITFACTTAYLQRTRRTPPASFSQKMSSSGQEPETVESLRKGSVQSHTPTRGAWPCTQGSLLPLHGDYSDAVYVVRFVHATPSVYTQHPVRVL